MKDLNDKEKSNLYNKLYQLDKEFGSENIIQQLSELFDEKISQIKETEKCDGEDYSDDIKYNKRIQNSLRKIITNIKKAIQEVV